jgi:hypothetical protein
MEKSMYIESLEKNLFNQTANKLLFLKGTQVLFLHPIRKWLVPE